MIDAALRDRDFTLAMDIETLAGWYHMPADDLILALLRQAVDNRAAELPGLDLMIEARKH